MADETSDSAKGAASGPERASGASPEPDTTAGRRKRTSPVIDLTAKEVETDTDKAHDVNPADVAADDIKAGDIEAGDINTHTDAGASAAADQPHAVPPDEPEPITGGVGGGDPPPHYPPFAPLREDAPRSNSGLAMALGTGLAGGALVLAILAGLYATGFLAQALPGGGQSTQAFDSRVVALQQQVQQLAARPAAANTDEKQIDALSNRIGKLEAAPAALAPVQGAADAAVAAKLAAAETEIKALSGKLSDLTRRADAQTALSTSAAVAHSDLEALTARIAALESDMKTTQNRLAQREANPSNDRVIRLALAGAALRDAVERGTPFSAELEAASQLTADRGKLDPLAAYAASGLPSAASLSRQLSELVPELRRLVMPATASSAGFLDRLQANAERLVRVRPVNKPAGDNAGAVVDRIEIEAANAEIDAALTDLAKLPEHARAPAEPWIKSAKSRAAALQASRRFAAEAVAGLGKPQAAQ